MTADACREWRGDLAASALGHLGAADALVLQAHLDGCPACRSELRELSAVVRALPLADPELVVGDPQAPPAELALLVRERVAREQSHVTRRRRGRMVALAAAAVLVVAVGVGALAVSRNDDAPSGTSVAFPATAEATGSARLTARDTGTEIALEADGLDAGDWYWLWLTDADGDRVGAGTFQGTGGNIDVTLTAALGLEDARRIWVTDGDDKVVLDARL